MPFTVKDLIGKRGLPITAKPDEMVIDALARMRENDFNQLPVVADDRRPLGMVTHASVVRSLGFLGAKLDSLKVREAMDQKFASYGADEDLFDLLDELGDTYALLIVDGEDRLTGIVTSYDATEFFRGRYEDLMVVEDIESTLKELIRIAFMGEAGEVDDAALGKLVADMESGRLQQRKAAQKVLGRYLAASDTSSSGSRFDEVLFRDVFDKTVPVDHDRTLDDLNLRELIQMLLDGGKWDVFKDVLGPDRESIRGLLEGVRETRNRLAHFREAPTAHERDRLRYCSELLTPVRRRLAQRRLGASVLPEPLTLQPVSLLSTEQVELGAEMVQPEDSRYARLALYLQGQSGATETIALPFRKIEEILGGRLPDSARVHRAWWANDTRSHIQARQWLDVGWRVSDISINEERVTFTRMREREQLYTRFFSELLVALREKTELPVRPARASGTNWLWVVDLPEGRTPIAHLGFSFALRNRFRVELYIDSGNRGDNKSLFDQLYMRRESIEADMGIALQWERLDERRASRVAVYQRGAITDEPKELEALKLWALDKMCRFYRGIESLMRGSE